jgi:hypothetical protein
MAQLEPILAIKGCKPATGLALPGSKHDRLFF